MDDFKESVIYEGDLPRPHRELEPYIDEERPSGDRGMLADIAVNFGSHFAGGSGAGFALNQGAKYFEVLEAIGVGDQTPLLMATPVVGAVAGGYVAFGKHKDKIEENRKWREAQKLERTSEDFSHDLAEHDFVVVRDYILDEGDPIERPGLTASALYDEVRGLEDIQFIEEIERGFPAVDYQLSLFSEGDPLRTFYVGEDIVDEVGDSYPETGDSFVEENLDSAVSLEEHR